MSNPWIQFRKEMAGKGFTQDQLKSMYRERKAIKEELENEIQQAEPESDYSLRDEEHIDDLSDTEALAEEVDRLKKCLHKAETLLRNAEQLLERYAQLVKLS